VKTDRVYLEHILDAIESISAYTQGGWEEFQGNPMIQDAVIRRFEIVGEAAKRLSDATTARHPEIPWRDVAAFRNVLIHDYMGVNLRRVWNVIEQNLPDLRRAVEDLLDIG